MLNEKKGVTKEKAAEVLEATYSALEKLPDFEIATVNESLKAVIKELNVQPGVLFGPVRIAVTGKMATPPLAESISALGREDTLKRLRRCVRQLAG